MSMSDRELNHLGAKFRLKKILIRLHVTFSQYLYKPDHYDKIIKFLDENKKTEELIIYGERRAIH